MRYTIPFSFNKTLSNVFIKTNTISFNKILLLKHYQNDKMYKTLQYPSTIMQRRECCAGVLYWSAVLCAVKWAVLVVVMRAV
jgi:hypothetical protein